MEPDEGMGIYSEMDNPQIIDQLERGPEGDIPDNIPVEITGADIPQEGESPSPQNLNESGCGPSHRSRACLLVQGAVIPPP